LTGQEAIDLPMLYQAEVSSLAVARSTILDRSLVGYLEALSLRAYLMVYGPRASLLELALKFFKTGLPRSVWALKFPILISFFIFFSSSLAGYVAVLLDPANYDYFMPDSVTQGRDFNTSSEKLASYLYGNWEGLRQALVHFANFLFRHNTQIAILCFSLGFFLGIPTILLLISNGLALGAMVALHFEKGLGLDFLAWVSIHGVTELSAIILAGGAGLSLAEKILIPGPGGRLENLGKGGKEAATVMIGVVLMLLCAGILEGCFRQLIDNTVTRLMVALLSALFWGLYFLEGRFVPKEE
jgi:uncharacterized membrane protein SpoIIM required for sporulation